MSGSFESFTHVSRPSLKVGEFDVAIAAAVIDEFCEGLPDYMPIDRNPARRFVLPEHLEQRVYETFHIDRPEKLVGRFLPSLTIQFPGTTPRISDEISWHCDSNERSLHTTVPVVVGATPVVSDALIGTLQVPMTNAAWGEARNLVHFLDTGLGQTAVQNAISDGDLVNDTTIQPGDLTLIERGMIHRRPNFSQVRFFTKSFLK